MLTLLGCSAAAEQRQLTRFFAASRLRDLTALREVATVVFEPVVDGVVTSFDIVDIAEARDAGGRVLSKDRSKVVSIAAPVRLPDGQTVVKTLAITMQRGLPGSDRNRWDGWMITAVSARPDAASTPRR
jgi:hypothetical protein